MAILRFGTIEVPEGHSSGIIAKAADLFTGYLMLDAWIGVPFHQKGSFRLEV
jgi:hypothetical protein